MTQSCKVLKRTGLSLMLLSVLSFSNGCATTGRKTVENLPPILSQAELQRPYDKMGVITVQRERYGAPGDLKAADYEWGYRVLRQEAAKMGADAVIYPEIKGERETYILFPSSEMTARGVAIKFR